MFKKLLIMFLTALSFSGGCSAVGYLGYLIAPEGMTKTVEPEYKELPGKKVAVVIFAEQDVLYEYPLVRYELGSAINDQFKKNVEKIQVVPAEQIIKFQDEDLDWDSMDKTALGKAFSVDYVLFVSLVEFSTREPGSEYLYRGRVSAQATLYKTSLPEREASVWQNPGIRLSYPEQEPVGQYTEDDRKIRIETERLFADMLTKKFYKHKVPKNK